MLRNLVGVKFPGLEELREWICNGKVVCSDMKLMK